MTNDHPQLLDVREASLRLGISMFTLRAWLRQGRLAHVRLGRRVLLRPADVERFVTDHVVPAATTTGESRS